MEVASIDELEKKKPEGVSLFFLILFHSPTSIILDFGLCLCFFAEN